MLPSHDIQLQLIGTWVFLILDTTPLVASTLVSIFDNFEVEKTCLIHEDGTSELMVVRVTG